jgi:hypothetical protein
MVGDGGYTSTMKVTPDDTAYALTEEEEWLNLTPEQRLEESGKLWDLYLAMGGSLDPEPDPQSPFHFPDLDYARTSHIEELIISLGRSKRRYNRSPSDAHSPEGHDQ